MDSVSVVFFIRVHMAVSTIVVGQNYTCQIGKTMLEFEFNPPER